MEILKILDIEDFESIVPAIKDLKEAIEADHCTKGLAESESYLSQAD